LLYEIIKNINIKNEKPNTKIIENNFSIYEGNSSNILAGIKEKISGAITSPPYYNAREYSQWPTMLCYLVDMAVNAKAVLEKMESGTYYFYNIGDIVGQDNVFVSSHMSNRRLMLGFYTIMIFEMLGYELLENIIWDKGQVQSKRNSTENIFPSYIKPINCYEHVLIFGKNAPKVKLSKKVFMIDTVRKINSKGENMLGHTAPYPEQLVELIFPYVNKDNGYLLDPYLGSGTTIIAGYKNGYKTVGVEYNESYFKLAQKRIELSISFQQNIFPKQKEEQAEDSSPDPSSSACDIRIQKK
jgi:DNA modification methylase